MRLGAAHEAGLFLATTLSFLLVLLGGEFPVVAWLVLAAPPLSWWLRRRGMAAPAGSGTMLALASLALGVAQVVAAGFETAVLAAGIALVGILTARLLTRESLEHDLQSLLLSLLLVLAGSVLNVGINYGFLFVGYALAAVWALTTRQLLSGAEQPTLGNAAAVEEAVRSRTDVVTPWFLLATGGVALFVLATTGVVFFAFPRMGFGNLGLTSDRTQDFPSAISLRGLPRAAVGSDDVVARVRGVPKDAFFRGLYLRGGVYDVVGYSGFSQADDQPADTRGIWALAPGPETALYEVYLAPVAGELLFSLGQVTAANVLTGGRANPNHRLAVRGANERSELLASARLQSAVRYQVRGGISEVGYVTDARNERHRLGEEEQAFFLRLPAGEDPQVRALVQEVVGDAATPVEKARRIRDWFESGFTYTLAQPSGTADEPLKDFLFRTRAGHCEYFATAQALFLRAVGIPSRVVGGYQGGKWDPDEEMVVFTGRNAHAWVEWFHEGVGWVVDDGTPTNGLPREELRGLSGLLERVKRFWDDTVLDYALEDQLDAMRQTRSALSRLSLETDPKKLLVGGLGLGLVVALLFLWRRVRRRRQTSAEHPLAAGLAAAVARLQGAEVSPAQTLREAALSIDEDLADERRVVLEVLEVYEAERFGGRVPSAEVTRAALERLARLAAPAPS